MKEVVLTKNQIGQRLDKVLFRLLPSAPTSFIFKMLRKKNITLNGKKADGREITLEGDVVRFFLSDETFEKMQGSNVSGGTVQSESNIPVIPRNFPKIRVLYEDSDVLVFEKPVGILSQKSVQTDFSMNEWVIAYAFEKGYLSEEDLKTFTPSVTNRLDRNTSGIMTAGISLAGLQELSEIFKEHSNEKYYYALVKGIVKETKLLEGKLSKDHEKNIVTIKNDELKSSIPSEKPVKTEITPIRIYDDSTLLSVRLYTGKTHQIRAHLSSIGHPILGDPKYGNTAFNQKYHMKYQCLCSCKLVFPESKLNGISGKTFKLEVPENWPHGHHED